MSAPQTSAQAARRRPLVQYVILSQQSGWFRVESSNAGTKPSHWLIDPPTFVGLEPSIEKARALVAPGYKRLARRKDDRADVVEVWV